MSHPSSAAMAMSILINGLEACLECLELLFLWEKLSGTDQVRTENFEPVEEIGYIVIALVLRMGIVTETDGL